MEWRLFGAVYFEPRVIVMHQLNLLGMSRG